MSLTQIYDLCADTLWLGRYSETGAREVGINVAGWLADLGTDGTFMLVAWRPGEDDLPYNPNITLDGSVVVWSPSNIDTAISGRGFAELRYYVGDVLAKEILMLTKMNWNSGDSMYKMLPVTLDFAKVLARMSKQDEAIYDKAYDFRFFM